MTTSNSVDFELNRSEIIHRALRLCRAIGTGETAQASEEQEAAIALNAMTKHWQTRGVRLWKLVEGVLHLTVDQTSYTLGPNSSDHVTTEGDSVKTELAADAAISATSLTVDSITGIAASDNIGIVLDDGTTHWDTVNGTPTGTTVVITTGLASAASTDTHVYAYTSLLPRPLRVIDARRRDDADQDIPIIVFSREEYMQTPNKTIAGLTTEVYYDPQLVDGTLYTWPAAESSNDRIIFTAYIPLEDFDGTDNTPDFPQEWMDVLCVGLAVRLDMEKGLLDADERKQLRADNTTLLSDVLAWDSEPTSVFFQPYPEW